MDDRQLVEDLLSALEYHTEQTRPIEFSRVAIEAAREYLRKPAQQEPVAYIHRQGNHYEVSERFLSDDEKSRGWTEEPLYTSPPAQRKPLTDEEIAKEFYKFEAAGAWYQFARAIEAKLRSKNEDQTGN